MEEGGGEMQLLKFSEFFKHCAGFKSLGVGGRSLDSVGCTRERDTDGFILQTLCCVSFNLSLELLF